MTDDTTSHDDTADDTVGASAPAGASRRRLRIAMMGTRGVPATYGGFETAVEEVGWRLAARGHDVCVFTRHAAHRARTYRGMRVVNVPAIRQKQLETLSHTMLSTAHALMGRRPDVAFLFNAANSPFVDPLRVRGIPVALHMDGLEWRRSKWGPRGKAYYRWAEQHGVRAADALIADAPGIADYYAHQFAVPTTIIRYGAPLLTAAAAEPVEGLGVTPGGYHLVVARFEPENHVLEIVRGYRASHAVKPLVVVGSAPYAARYSRDIAEVAAADPRIRLLGSVYDQAVLDALYFHAYTYAHGHSVGGTNPSLLRAMGAGRATVAFDVTFNREVLDGRGWFFTTADEATVCFDEAEADPRRVDADGRFLQQRAGAAFRWDDVADAYEQLAVRLADGHSVHHVARHARRNPQEWHNGATAAARES